VTEIKNKTFKIPKNIKKSMLLQLFVCAVMAEDSVLKVFCQARVVTAAVAWELDYMSIHA